MAWAAAGAYLVLTIAATWPLVLGLGRDVAWDLGDSLLNMWILAWDCEQLRATLSGDLSRARAFFDANIFYPAPLTLAYSEHLIAQAVQVLPLYLATENPILCYNVLFLSTFVLSGLGTFLFVRELTGNAVAAFAAGLVFAFIPYRLPQSSHLQVLSSQWMPFALYGFLRYFKTRRRLPLAGAALALVAQNLSCGYYLLYFSPFAAAYVLWEMTRRRLWRDTHTWLDLVGAAVVVVALTLPFVLPYARVRSDLQLARSSAEIARFSADVYSYATAFSEQRVWGRAMRALPKPEGELFPGLIPVLLALVGAAAALARPAGAAGGDTGEPPRQAGHRAPRWVGLLLAAIAIAHAVAAIATVLLRRIVFDAGLFVLRIGNINQLLVRGAVAFGLLLAVSPAARMRASAFLRNGGFFAVALAAAVWLSLGPVPQALGRRIELAAPYAALIASVPGFEGLRVPARMAMVAMLMLACLGGYGAAALTRWRSGRYLLAALCSVFLIEATHVPFLVNGTTPVSGFNSPEARVYRPARAPAVYRALAGQPPDAVIAELPLGPADFDLRAVYYSTAHWKRLLNGYSGFYPPHYFQLQIALTDIPRHPDYSLDALRAGGATHLVIHEGAYLGTEGPDTTSALRSLGAVELFRDGGDVLLALPQD